MQCAACDQEMPNQGAICIRCNAPAPSERQPDTAPVSHHALARTVRRLKGLVFVSLTFGIFAAPFAVYIAARALTRYGGSTTTDPATLRQLIQLRRVATGLLVVWAFAIGGWAASFLSAGPSV
jgi:hypothetical protein